MLLKLISLLGVFFSKSYAQISQCSPTLPSLCPAPPFILTDTNGNINCATEASCCDCELIECLNCESVICEGINSCFGTRINIDGGQSGATLSCNLDRSCEAVNVTATDITSIKCDAQSSCSEGIFSLNIGQAINPNIPSLQMNCNGDSSCDNTIINANNVGTVNCNGDFSCIGSQMNLNGNSLFLNCEGNNGCQSSTITANNVFSFDCSGNSGCFTSAMNVDCLTDGCDVMCTGASGCRSSKFNIDNVRSVQCDGDSGACRDSNFTLNCIGNGCPINCNNGGACEGVRFDITNSFGLSCVGSRACGAITTFIPPSNIIFRSSVFNLNNNIGGSFKCEGLFSCDRIIVNSLDNIDSIDCFGNQACREANIIGTCNSNTGCQVTCQGRSSCVSASITTTNVAAFRCNGVSACSEGNFEFDIFDNTFEITTGEQSSASDARFNVKVLDNNINSIKGISCEANVAACLRSTFIIDASQITGILNIESIICSGVGACLDTVFRLINAEVEESNFMCVDSNSCVNTTIICQDKIGNVLPVQTCVTMSE